MTETLFPEMETQPIRQGEKLYRCLSLWQPWATLMAIGAKQIETRSWPAARAGLKPGELVAVHAARRWTRDLVEITREPFFLEALAPELERANLPLGAVLSLHRFAGCFPTGAPKCLTPQELAFGNYDPGRYGWCFELIHRFKVPLPAVGHQGVFWWPCPCDAQLEMRR